MKTQELLEALRAPEITGNALADQQAWERHAIELGKIKVLKDLKHDERRGGFQTRSDAQRVIKGALPLVTLQIVKWTEENTRGQGQGKSQAAVGVFKQLDTDGLALIALSSVFGGIAPKSLPLQTVAVTAGRQVEVALEAEALKDADPKKAKMIAKLISKEASTKRNEKLHDSMAEKAGVRMGWDDTQRLKIGEALIECVLHAVPELFERELKTVKVKGGYQSENCVVLTEEGQGYMLELQEALGWMNPKLLPMVAVPMDWHRMDTGAYRDSAIAKTVPMVRTRLSEQKRLIKEAMESGSMDAMVHALNSLQRTGMRIDTLIKDVEEWCFDSNLQPGGTGGSFPTKARIVPTRPTRPQEIDEARWEAECSPERLAASKMTDEEWATQTDKFVWTAHRLSDLEWKMATQAKRKAISRQNNTVRQIRLTRAADVGVFKSDMDTADWLSKHPVFYQPHTLDSRGRIYTAAHFGHQRSDHIKALFRFAEGKPLGEFGGFWLMIHLANSGDFEKISKKTFDDRIDWVHANHERILLAAEHPDDPEAYEFWANADNPFLFLQACMEYTAWAWAEFSEDFVSDLPIALDGSCSGIQHYSAIMRSAPEAHHVNLTPRKDVGDLYGVVANAAIPMIQVQADPENYEAAKAKLMAKKETKTRAKDLADLYRRHLSAIKVLTNAFGRGTAKRNVMTYAYSAPEQGMRGQQMEDLMDPLQAKVDLGELEAHPYALEIVDKEHERFGESDGGSAAAACIAHHVYNATVSTLPDAQRGMEWLQTTAGILAAEEKSVVWRTPMGFPVVSRYNEWDVKTVHLWLYDRKVPVLEAGPRDRVDEDTGRVSSKIDAVLRTSPKKTIDKRAARSAIAPNVIHSLDAAHVFKTVELAVAAGITSFAMIHDSFATHAGDTQEFFGIIRVAFARLYEDYCPFVEIDRYARTVLSPEGIEKLPPIPTRGTLDLLDVIGSPYAFA